MSYRIRFKDDNDFIRFMKKYNTNHKLWQRIQRLELEHLLPLIYYLDAFTIVCQDIHVCLRVDEFKQIIRREINERKVRDAI